MMLGSRATSLERCHFLQKFVVLSSVTNSMCNLYVVLMMWTRLTSRFLWGLQWDHVVKLDFLIRQYRLFTYVTPSTITLKNEPIVNGIWCGDMTRTFAVKCKHLQTILWPGVPFSLSPLQFFFVCLPMYMTIIYTTIYTSCIQSVSFCFVRPKTLNRFFLFATMTPFMPRCYGPVASIADLANLLTSTFFVAASLTVITITIFRLSAIVKLFKKFFFLAFSTLLVTLWYDNYRLRGSLFGGKSTVLNILFLVDLLFVCRVVVAFSSVILLKIFKAIRSATFNAPLAFFFFTLNKWTFMSIPNFCFRVFRYAFCMGGEIITFFTSNCVSIFAALVFVKLFKLFLDVASSTDFSRREQGELIGMIKFGHSPLDLLNRFLGLGSICVTSACGAVLCPQLYHKSEHLYMKGGM